MSKVDRDEIKPLYVGGNGSVWKREPTVIQAPINLFPPPHPMNPFSENPNRPQRRAQTRASTNFGNLTAKQIIATPPNREPDGRATKRQKFDHIQPRIVPTLPKIPSGQPRPLLAPERSSDVDEMDAFGDERTRRGSSYQNTQSEDELNMRPGYSNNAGVQTSKYDFPVAGNVAPDGIATQWAEGRYGGSTQESPEHDSIKDFTPEPESVRVKDKVAKIEERVGPKVNLSKFQYKGGKAKKMQPKLTNDSLTTTNGVLKISLASASINRDPIASASTSFKTTNRRKEKSDKEDLQLLIQEAYFGPQFYPSPGDRSATLHWSAEKLGVKVNDVDTFSRSGIEWEGWHCTYSPDPPLIELKGRDCRDPVITIKFNQRHWKTGAFDKLQLFFKKHKISCSRTNGSQLWEIAERFTQDQEGLDMLGANRMKELQIIQEKRKNLSLERSQNPNPLHKANPQRTSVASSNSRPESSEGMNFGAAPRQIRPDIMNQNAGPSNLRRSARTVGPPKVTPAPDQDEVILVYPQGSPGAVNITNGDLARLAPGEYLNDTLIEFGLKHWLGQLEMTNPALASQVHVFNSFFYKKLVHKKDPEQAFESVRKWTSKFDIFQKKYIIVPINENFHWYLAIIYEPEHVLIPIPEVPSTRKDTRSSVKHDIFSVPTIAALMENNRQLTPADRDDDDSITPSIKHDASVLPTSQMSLAKKPRAPVDNSDDDMYVPSSEAEVERNLYDGFRSSCHIVDDVDDQLAAPASVVDSDNGDEALSYVTDKADLSANGNPAEESPSITDENLDFGRPSDKAMLVDGIEDMDIMVVDQHDDGRTTSKLGVDSSADFVGANKVKGKLKAISKTHLSAMDVDTVEGDVVVLDPAPKTYIFTLDSLGTRHPRAIAKLAAYLKLEARDKKRIPNASLAQGKMASVPTQPNFCDCGIYLIHFVETFMADPKRYWHSILVQKPTRISNKERQDEWHDEKVASMREDLATRIRKLSRAWKQERCLKEASKDPDDRDDKVNLVQSSDSDIDIVDPSPKTARAKRLRG